MLLSILKERGLEEKPTREENIEFLDDDALIKLGNKRCQLPPYKNEHFFCRAAFEHPVDEPIDWSIIYEKMTGEEVKDKEKNKRTVYDTLIRINKRVEKILGIKNLFVWGIKTIKRTC